MNIPFASETLYSDQILTPESVAEWSALKGERDYIIRMGFPTPEQLSLLLPLKGAKKLKLEVQQYPKAKHLEAWQALFNQFNKKIELVLFGTPLPNAEQVELLNQISPNKIIFVILNIPFLYEVEPLLKLQAKEYSLTLIGPRYPLDPFTEGPAFQALPASVDLLFVSKSWPDQYNRAFFNKIPQKIKIRVSETMPTANSLTELSAIERLAGVQLEWEGEIKPTFWESLPAVPLKWTVRDWIPSEKSLAGFAAVQSAAELILDRDQELADWELKRLTSSKLNIHWIHRAP